MGVYYKKNKWYYEFMLNGERKHGLCAGAKTEKQAISIENDFKFILQKQQNGVIPRELKKIKIKDVTTLYEKHCKINNKDQEHWKARIKGILEYFGENKDVNTISPMDIEVFKLYLIETKKLTNATANRYHSLLSKSFNLAVNEGWILKNPCKGIKPLLENGNVIRYLTKEEEIKLYKELPEHLKPIVTCALHTGLRRSNILNMRWEHVDLEFGFIEVLKQDNKGKKIIKIPISEKLREVFEQLNPKQEGYVFVNPNTNKPYNDIRDGFNGAVTRSKIPNFRFHDLRHTVATRLVEKGIDLTVVKELLAHSEISTTMKYAHPVPKRKLEAIEVLNSYN